NDCDGLIDCFDPTCTTLACGPNGRGCDPDGGCVCSGNGGVIQTVERACTDGHDNDCNGLTDCADPGCATASCGANGKVCTDAGVCGCSGNGGTAQQTETICNDGHDNDCNGATDCAETSCRGSSCGTFGKICGDAGSCACSGNGGTSQASETLCTDGKDNDCDGLTDCAD